MWFITRTRPHLGLGRGGYERFDERADAITDLQLFHLHGRWYAFDLLTLETNSNMPLQLRLFYTGAHHDDEIICHIFLIASSMPSLSSHQIDSVQVNIPTPSQKLLLPLLHIGDSSNRFHS